MGRIIATGPQTVEDFMTQVAPHDSPLLEEWDTAAPERTAAVPIADLLVDTAVSARVATPEPVATPDPVAAPAAASDRVGGSWLSRTFGAVSSSSASSWGSPADFLEDEPLVESDEPAFAGIRLPDGRALVWADYGNPRGIPCLLIPDSRSSRLAPTWLLHDSAVPSAVRLMALDRPGTGRSDPVAFNGDDDLAGDVVRMIRTLAVGSVVAIGVGSGVAVALELAEREPRAVSQVIAVSARTGAEPTRPAGRRLPVRRSRRTWQGALAAWVVALRHDDPLDERSWGRALRRMDEHSRAVLGERWHDADFRAAVAADVLESENDWIAPAVESAPRWTERWNGSAPVHFWHGKDDPHTPLSAIRTLAGRRAGWTVTAVPGTTTLFGCWPQILQDAASTYLQRTAR